MTGGPHTDRPAVRHVEVFVSHRSGVRVQVPCWCFLGVDHSYEQWRGPTTGPAIEPGLVAPADPDRPVDGERAPGSRPSPAT